MSCLPCFYFVLLLYRQFLLFCNNSMPAIQINTPFNIALDFEVAALHKRILAYVCDLIVLVIYSWGMRVFLYDVIDVQNNSYGIDIVLVSIPMWLYALICEVTMHGQ